MASSPSAATKPLLLVFGPLPLSIDISTISGICELANNSNQGWLLDISFNLVKDYSTARPVLSSLGQDKSCHETGAAQLDSLSRFVDRNATAQERARAARSISLPLANKLLIPLVLVAQLAQYGEFLVRAGMDHGLQSSGPESSDSVQVEAVGYCVGLLSAFVVTSSRNEAQFRMYAAAAIRLGMLIGSVVDIHEGPGGPKSGALSISWQQLEADGGVPSALESILKSFPETYMSNWFDRNSATVTGPLHTLSSLRHSLKAASIQSTIVSGLHGRYHDTHHTDPTAKLEAFCDAHPEFQLPDASACCLPPRLNDGKGAVRQGRLHQHALRAILVDTLRWFETFRTVEREFLRDGEVIVFGLERPIPPSRVSELASRVKYNYMSRHAAGTGPTDYYSPDATLYSKDDIAIVGMSAKVAGADSLEEFWDLLCAGKSQHVPVPRDRFGVYDKTMLRTPDQSRRWFANLLSAPEEFDHRFFGKTPRESAAMDPQQRLMLQVAYQAVEQAGHLNSSSSDRVGCFVGCSTCDYEQNVACHAPTAFSATGQLRAFAAGRVSHFFGWTGPSVTLDTACSSSAVAVHQACRAIVAGDCDAALAGGAFVMCGPQWFQDLGAASFLSPTGQCKPFDAAADGYCRGDGVAAVFLKRMDKALADGDEILGVIGATVVQQNRNSTPIVVPNESSLSDLFSTALDKAGVDASHVSVIEAHGTGTAVGDPAEYGAIRQVFGGSKRHTPLSLGSVKGTIGHTECTAGVISLIKVVLMMCKAKIPPQVSFNTINPSLKASPADMIDIQNTGSVKAWDVPNKVALVNSYGASGSNTCILVKQPPRAVKTRLAVNVEESGDRQYPFWLSAHDEQALRRCAGALHKFISNLRDKPSAGIAPPSLAKISASASRQRHRTLPRSLFTKASTLDELERKLQAFRDGVQPHADASTPAPVHKPVILCFGGQVSTSVGLDRDVFDRTAILRKHLDEVDAVARAQGAGSIYPAIFQTTPLADPVQLQVALLALQYATARCWMDCGLEPASVVGHSFGEFAAACVTGVLSLRDTVRLVACRARLVRDRWGADRGRMLAVEADLADVRDAVAGSGGQAAVACYNGPRSFTLSGTTAAVEAIAMDLDLKGRAASGASKSIKVKLLNVSHAFHSPLVESQLVEGLGRCAQTLTFSRQTIHMEKAVEFEAGDEGLDATYFPSQMRNPVYFHHAVKRLADRYQSTGAIFLEAGSASTITNMASRALVGQPDGHFKFQPIAITSGGPATKSTKCWDGLVDATLNLWRAGAGPASQFWAHHPLQARSDPSPPLLLPPYQFEPSRHWLDRLPLPGDLPGAAGDEATHNASPSGLVCFDGLVDGDSDKIRFRVNNKHPRYKKLMDGHLMARTAAVCPVFVQLDLVVQALSMTICTPPGLQDNRDGSSLLSALGKQPLISDVVCSAPLCDNPDQMVWLEMPPASTQCNLLRSKNNGDDRYVDRDHGDRSEFHFEVYSTDKLESASGPGLHNKIVHTTGKITLASRGDPAVGREVAQFARLVDMGQVERLLHGSAMDLDNSLSHNSVYHMFEDVVEYCAEYRGIQRLISRDRQTAAIVNRRLDDDDHAGQASWIKPCTADTLAQVAGMWMNCLAVDRDPTCIYVFSGLERWLRVPGPEDHRPPSDMHVLATHHRTSDRSAVSDVFAFDASTGKLLEVMLGVSWAKVPRSNMQRTLARCAGASRAEPTRQVPKSHSAVTVPFANTVDHGRPEARHAAKSDSAATGSAKKQEVAGTLINILVQLSGLDACDVTHDSELVNLGIDSLMNMELASDIRGALKLEVDEGALMEARTVAELISYVQNLVELQSPSSRKPPSTARQAVVMDYVRTMTQGWATPLELEAATKQSTGPRAARTQDRVVVVTGGTGGLGAHLVARLATDPSVARVICLNRRKPHSDAAARQHQAVLAKTGLDLDDPRHSSARSKLVVWETDLSQPALGLDDAAYGDLTRSAGEIVHNGWLMTLSRGVDGFEPQLRVMRRVLDLARDAALRQPAAAVVFQFVSSVAVVGRAPAGAVCEERVRGVESVLPAGYAEAKWACELMVDATLHDGRWGGAFRPMVVRLGQIAASRATGYWNAAEHVSFMIKSSLTLGVLPRLGGVLSWTPVEDVAGTLVDLLAAPRPYPVYHVDNPVRQPWGDMIALLGRELGLHGECTVPFGEWVRRVRELGAGAGNPAYVLVDFLEANFEHISCGGMLLETSHSQEHSETMRQVRPFDAGLVRLFIQRWKESGFLPL
ncbi:Type I Iterative PKS [Pyricularia oryzae]|nr:Type I Iterative PKS [Pyricularia oryzae]